MIRYWEENVEAKIAIPFDLKVHDKELLDKIRAEIEQRPYGIANDSVIQGMKYERTDILEILDKYKAESDVV